MAAKNNIRSIRFSDDTLEAIEAQVGRNFTEKFENMVTRCLWELPAAEQKLNVLEGKIQDKRKQLIQLEEQIRKLKTLGSQLDYFEEVFQRTIQTWEV